jgi:YhcH/YjgK/YiaL family protein
MFAGDLGCGGMAGILAVHPVLRRCMGWVEAAGGVFAEGITQLDGDRFFVNVHGYETKAREACRWESHRATADFQYCISGGECIDWSLEPAAGVSEYIKDRDFEYWAENPADWSSLHLAPGGFAFFAPGELHRPMVTAPGNSAIRKLVFKISADYLQE